MSEVAERPAMTGLEALMKSPLLETMWHRRTHRVSRGVPVIQAGSMTYRSTQKLLPLNELEEAVLIAITGCSGLTMPDRPFQDPSTNEFIMAKPNLGMDGRTAGSPDNAQGTHFFMINDSGTYYLRKLPSPDVATPLNAELLIERACLAKVQILDHRIDVQGSRKFPAYLDSNQFLSNLPGTTVFFPVVDLSHQYINGLIYLLSEPEGARPTLVDDRNFYKMAGVAKSVKSGFLNKDIEVPLGVIGPLRTQIEADLLLQNLMLVAEGMGLGAWIHASLTPSIILGDPKFTRQYGKMLGFDFVTPPFRLLDAVRWQVPFPKYANLRSHPVGLKIGGEYVIQAMSPPYYPSMSAAVDAVIAQKFGPGGVYKDDYRKRYLHEAAKYNDDVIQCARGICEYIHRTHGRFPRACGCDLCPGGLDSGA